MAEFARSKCVFLKVEAKIKFFCPLVLLKFATEAHILADYPIVTFDR